MKNFQMNIKGFTLVELLVASAIGGIVITAIFTVYNNQHHSYVVQENIADTQQNLRIAKDMLVRDIRMAGSRVSKYIGIIPINSTIGSDSITISYGDPNFPTMIIKNYSSGLFNVEIDSSHLGGKISQNTVLLVSRGSCRALITTINDITLQQTTTINFTTNPIPTLPDTTYYTEVFDTLGSGNCSESQDGAVVSLPILRSYSLSGTNLLLFEYNGTNGGVNNISTLAEDISDLQFVYILEPGVTTDDIRFDGIGTDNDITSGDRVFIREIRISILSRTSNRDNQWSSGVRPDMLGDYNYAGGTIDPNDPNYHWRLLNTTSYPRNLSFNEY